MVLGLFVLGIIVIGLLSYLGMKGTGALWLHLNFIVA